MAVGAPRQMRWTKNHFLVCLEMKFLRGLCGVVNWLFLEYGQCPLFTVDVTVYTMNTIYRDPAA